MMAMRDLVIRPRIETLRYAAGMFDQLRQRFADIQERRDVSEEIYQMAKLGRHRALSARITMENEIEEIRKDTAAASAIEARRAATPKSDAVEDESAVPKGDAHE